MEYKPDEEKADDKAYEHCFNWSEYNEMDEDKEILLNDFKNDLAADPLNQNDLETNMLTTSTSKRKVAPPPKMTSDDKQPAMKQPKVHESNRGFMESVFGTCCAVDHDLNKRELKFYNKFAQSMICEYDRDVPEHEQNLKKLYAKAFGVQPDMNDVHSDGRTMLGDLWKDIGFQGKDPRTDFRGGGHLSLLCILYVVDNYRNEWDELATCTKDQENLMWLTAITSINLTHSLIIYFHM